MLRSLQGFTEKYSVNKVIICWDSKGGSQWRKSIFPHYKANRSGVYKDMEDYFEELRSCREYLEVCGIPQAPCQGIEADDVIGWLAKKYSDEGWEPIIFSNDSDMFQLLRIKHATLWRSVKAQLYDSRDVAKEMDIEAEHLHKLQGLTGQKKDNIPGPCDLDSKNIMKSCRFGNANALKLLKHESNPDCTMKRCKELLKSDSPVSPRLTEILLNKWDQILVSVKLAKIRTRDEDYQEWEIKTLREVKALADSMQPVQVTQLNHVAALLDIKAVSIPLVCRRVGVPIKGKVEEEKKVKVRFEE
jgi:5'-3' exonuclease